MGNQPSVVHHHNHVTEVVETEDQDKSEHAGGMDLVEFHHNTFKMTAAGGTILIVLGIIVIWLFFYLRRRFRQAEIEKVQPARSWNRFRSRMAREHEDLEMQEIDAARLRYPALPAPDPRPYPIVPRASESPLFHEKYSRYPLPDGV